MESKDGSDCEYHRSDGHFDGGEEELLEARRGMGEWVWELRNVKVFNWKPFQGYVTTFIAASFLLLLMFCVWMVAMDAQDPQLVSLPWRVQEPAVQDLPPVAADYNGTEVPFIRGTSISGEKAVGEFRAHLECLSDGKWVYDPTPRHIPWNTVGDLYASTCDYNHVYSGGIFGDAAEAIARDGGPEDWKVREELKWVWQTNSAKCPMKPFDRDEFCKKIGRKSNILIVGDSLNQQIFWSMINNLIVNTSAYTHFSAMDRSTDGLWEMCGDILGTGSGFKVGFVRNDRLSPTINETVDHQGNFYEYPWVDLLIKYDVKMLLMNRGAHYENDEIYTTALRTIFTILRDKFPHIQVIYRNTMPGHVNCTSFLEPSDNLTGNGYPPSWHWGDFPQQNKLAKAIVEEFEYTYMDVYTMLHQRPDGHISQRDCLHYCVPGPLDFAVQLFYNIFLLH